MSREKTDISVEITCELADLEVDFERLEELAESVCLRFGTVAATVSIAIVGDAAIEKVNTEFLNESHETDVISFDLSDGPGEAASFELIVNADEARRQGQARNHSMQAELALYITHGLLHNLGFDDAEAIDSRRMHETEDEILRQAGFGTVYDK